MFSALYADGGKLTPLPDAEDGVFLFAPGVSRDRLVRYAVLLVLSAVIATGGVLVDSTATVVGAMIVAPLATPILAVGMGITIVDTGQVMRSLAVVGSSIAAVVLIGMFMTLVLPVVPSEDWVLSNGQITGRVAPGLIELVVAVATGMIGAFAVTRRDVAGVLPGVAIAISLVPPLAVVGVLLSAGFWAQSAGALLLFLSNAIAMVVTAAFVFWIAGYWRAAADRSGLRRAVQAIVAVSVVVVALLTLVSVYTVALASQHSRAVTAAQKWLSGSDYRLIDVQTKHTDLVVEVLGSGPLPDTRTFFDSFNAPLWLDPAIILREYRGTNQPMPEPGSSPAGG